MKSFIFTCGDINGIGPEIVIKSLNKLSKKKSYHYIFICPKNVFLKTSEIVKPEFNFEIISKIKHTEKNRVSIFDIGNFVQRTGKTTKAAGKAAFKSIKLSFELIKKNYADAVITAPISKEAINLAGINFPGHTEMYAKWCGVNNFVMMFFSDRMNAALYSIHEPVKKVSSLLNKNGLKNKLNIVVETLLYDLKIKNPKAAILGLNPHAGENGIIGSEEKKIIIPVIKNHKYSKFLSGPFSPDAFFGSNNYKKFDVVFGIYHDQVLIPFKLMNFSSGVNYTAGLPIVRTSPDHGTAYDIAGKNLADESSILEAFYFAEKIVKNRKTNADL